MLHEDDFPTSIFVDLVRRETNGSNFVGLCVDAVLGLRLLIVVSRTAFLVSPFPRRNCGMNGDTRNAVPP